MKPKIDPASAILLSSPSPPLGSCCASAPCLSLGPQLGGFGVCSVGSPRKEPGDRAEDEAMGVSAASAKVSTRTLAQGWHG